MGRPYGRANFDTSPTFLFIIKGQRAARAKGAFSGDGGEMSLQKESKRRAKGAKTRDERSHIARRKEPFRSEATPHRPKRPETDAAAIAALRARKRPYRGRERVARRGGRRCMARRKAMHDVAEGDARRGGRRCMTRRKTMHGEAEGDARRGDGVSHRRHDTLSPAAYEL